MNRTWDKIMFGIFKEMLIVLITNIVNASNYTKYVSLRNQKCEIQSTHINLHPNEYSQEFHYNLFVVKLDRCAGSCNTLNDLSNKAYVPSKTEYLYISVFAMIPGINESKTQIKHMSCGCKCKFNGRKCNSNQRLNNMWA